MNFVLLLLVLSGVFAQNVLCANGDSLEQYNVVWRTPSKDSSGSMPIGNGDVGLNVWVEQEGGLLLYISKTDAWSENCRLLKLGRCRVKLSPNPFSRGVFFRQILKLREGEIEIRAGEKEKEVILRVWVDANNPVVRIEAEGEREFSMQVSLEMWRTEERELKAEEIDSAYGLHNAPHPVIVYPDTILQNQKDRIALGGKVGVSEGKGDIVWYHRNENSIWPETMRLQGLEGLMEKYSDPLLYRTFGGAIKALGKGDKGESLTAVEPTKLKSAEPSRSHLVSIYLHTKQIDTIEGWLEGLEELITRVETKTLEQSRSEHLEWWGKFWKRSWIFVSGGKDSDIVTRGYILQRFINACGGRGAYPIKFNGTIFTVDALEHGKVYDADYRRWGGPYWFQNTRLTYWPMIASGDFDLMKPLFKMYIDALSFAKERTKIYFGHEGAFFPETMYFWGAYANDNYGWDRKGKPVSHIDNRYIRYYWQSGLELIAMMLDCYTHTQNEELACSSLLPLAEAIVCFYDEHHPRDKRGKLILEPAQSLETWWDAGNPLPDIAGLRFVLEGLLTLPSKLTLEKQRETWKRLLREMPDLPTTQANGKVILSPAENMPDSKSNAENPELYAIFPYRLYGVGKPDLEMALRTFAMRRFKGNRGWQQDDIQAAYLGLALEARRYVSERFSRHHAGSRFPAFWGPNFDWIPDQDHGSVGLMSLQTMLMQADEDKIFLFPAWPRDWDVEFKLHVPQTTTVEGTYRSGKLINLKVKPQLRNKDVVLTALHD